MKSIGLDSLVILTGTLAIALVGAVGTPPARAQSALQGVDMNSPAMTETEFTREQVVALIESGAPLDFTRRRLNGIDLSGLDLTGAIFRAARLNNTNLSGAILSNAVLDQAWMMNADLSGTQLDGASLFQAQLRSSNLSGANLSNARTAGDFTRATLDGADFTNADFSADMKNQSMGLMRGVLRKTKAVGTNFSGANFMRADLEFANLSGANFENANLAGTTLGGADFTGARIAGAHFADADLTSTRLVGVTGETDGQFAAAKNVDRAFRK